jgi:N-acetyl-gamma-glutamyl-phosphate reductase
MLKVAIAGATGYTGAELLRLLVRHPKVEIVGVTSEQSFGEPITTRLPFLKGHLDLILEKLDPDSFTEKADLVFSALSHTQGMRAVQQWIETGKKVIDLSADYRLQSPDLYEKWYKTRHLEHALLKRAIYGLSEIYRKQIAQGTTRLIANPGCYPTGALLPLYPFLKSGEVDVTREIIIDAKSGVSGAGRSPTSATHFTEAHEGFAAYNIGSHRHIPEIEQALNPFHATMLFTPHLLPVNRGLLTTIYLPLKRALLQDQLESILEEYTSEPFIRLVDHAPNLNDVKGSNYCDIAVFPTRQGRTAILISAIDNLVKGASGQAIQNMNIMMGWEETEGLEAPGFFP